jgi:hypothetical protein
MIEPTRVSVREKGFDEKRIMGDLAAGKGFRRNFLRRAEVGGPGPAAA